MVAKISGFNAAVEGMRRQGERVARDAQDINRAFAAAQNAMAADSVKVSDKAAVVPAVEDAMQNAVVAPEGDVTAALVDILQAKHAYKANAATAKVTGDLENELMRVFDRKA